MATLVVVVLDPEDNPADGHGTCGDWQLISVGEAEKLLKIDNK
jgi:hypothetical protein